MKHHPGCRDLRLWLVLFWFLGALCLLWPATLASAAQRFPPPDFESGHQLPVTATPPARALLLGYVDIAVLVLALTLATWLVFKKRSRKGVIGLSLFSLAYFGFWRKGCICSIGSVQNIALGLCDPAYAVPWTVIAFFLLPVMFALFAGRVFCAGVCPHGALQDLVLLKPLKLPYWLEQALGVLPYLYLGAGVLLAATGSIFLFCQYDPFVAIFRMSGGALMVVIGAVFLLLSVFVGRPFCRFLCPFGALLKLGATVAGRRVRVTPDYCTQCRLCESSCPFGAMREPQTGSTDGIDPESPGQARRRLAFLIVLLPLFVAGGAWLGGSLAPSVSRLNPKVSLAERFVPQRSSRSKPGASSPDELAMERARHAPKETLSQAMTIRRKLTVGGRLFGAWAGLVIAAKLLSLSIRRGRKDYEPERGDCVGCARCFEFCPNELRRRGVVLPAALAVEGGPSSSIALSGEASK